ncbi:MAG TPA: 50S ribosomal protein L11 methyltransferase [Casimicrobiaceae bacterium]|nr:50S ribosomal protein L11 methyltransferase [Casimicrobiaceae bacterium]
MSYRALRFEIPGNAIDCWSDALLDAGALSVDVSDPAAGTADEIAIYAEPGESGAWTRVCLTALFAGDRDSEDALASAAAALSLPVPAHDVHDIAEQDWVRATQAQFAPIRIDDRLWIVPSWCEPPDPNALNLRLDPGVAFGTGSHPTTRMCLAWLREVITPGSSVLDYGCGSGVLAIAAAKLGAARVVGVDIDALAVAASIENARRNRATVRFCDVDSLGPESFDIVVANILANPLIALAPVLAGRVRTGGHIALAGLLVPQVDEVSAAYTRWFNIAPSRAEDGWSLLAGVRR